MAINRIIRPSDLESTRNNPNPSEWMVVDDGVTVAKSTVKDVVEAGRPVASRSEAEAGVNAEKAMTPLTTHQKIEYEIGRTLASKAQGDKADSAVQEVVAGANVAVDNTNPQRPIISADGGVSDGNKGDVIVSGSGAVWGVPRLTVDSRAWAILNLSPEEGPEFIQTAGYYSAGDGGDGLYAKSPSEPPHAAKFSITLSGGGGVVWYELLKKDGGVNVKQLGAKCDFVFGVGGTDDTQAVLDSIDFLLSAGANFTGGTVYFPAGACAVTQIDITGLSGLEFKGAGRGVSWLVGETETTKPFVFGCDGYVQGGISTETYHIKITSLSITAARPGNYYQDCVRIHAGREWEIRDFTIGGNSFSRSGLKMQYAYTHSIADGTVSNFNEVASNFVYSVLIGSGSGADSCNNIGFTNIKTVNKAPDRTGKTGTVVGFGVSGRNINFFNVDASLTDIGFLHQAVMNVQYVGSYAEYVLRGIDQMAGVGFTYGQSVVGFLASIIAGGTGIRLSNTSHQSRDSYIHNINVVATGAGAVAIDYGPGSYGLARGYVYSSGLTLSPDVGAPIGGGGIGRQYVSSEISIAPDGVVEISGVPTGINFVTKTAKLGNVTIFSGGITTPAGILAALNIGDMFISSSDGSLWTATATGTGGWVAR